MREALGQPVLAEEEALDEPAAFVAVAKRTRRATRFQGV